MTTIDLRTVALALGKPEGEPVNAIVAFTPYVGGTPIVRVEGTDVIIPSSIIVRLVDGAPTDPIDLPPTVGVFCYRVTVSADDGALEPRYVEVPDDDNPVAFGSLPLVDPDTYLPVSPTLPGAAELIADAAVILELAETAADTANAAAKDAELARVNAVAAYAQSIIDAELVGYELTLVARDGARHELGDVRGEQGIQGIQGIQGDLTPSDTVYVTAATVFTINLNGGPQTVHRTLAGSVTVNFNPAKIPASAYTMTVVVKQDATGSRTITWPAIIKWPEGMIPQPSPAPNAITVFTIMATGVEILGFVGGQNFA